VSLRDTRRPPFTWVANDAMAVIRREVPATRQAGVRNAYLATAEAASARGDHEHREGDTITEIARFACVTERRIREHLQELEYLGLIDVEKRQDVTGRDLATRYEIRDAPRPDKSSYRSDGSAAKTSDPTRGRPTVVKKEKREEPPLTPPKGGRARDRELYKREKATWLADRAPHPATVDADWEAVRAELLARVGETSFNIWLAGLHPHATVSGVLYLAAPAERAAYAATRFGRVIEQALAGRRFDVIECEKPYLRSAA
jgi:hypothetical protein